jgi:hypothetical protein
LRCHAAIDTSARVDLIRRELVHVPNITEGPAHFLYDVHLFEGGLQRLGGRVHRSYRGMTGLFSCHPSALSKSPRSLPGFPQALPLLPHNLERLTMLIADLARFFGQLSEPFGLIPGSLPQIFLEQPGVFGLSVILRHVGSSSC